MNCLAEICNWRQEYDGDWPSGECEGSGTALWAVPETSVHPVFRMPRHLLLVSDVMCRTISANICRLTYRTHAASASLCFHEAWKKLFTVRRDLLYIRQMGAVGTSAIGVTTGEKLEGTSRGVDADPFRLSSPVPVSTIFSYSSPLSPLYKSSYKVLASAISSLLPAGSWRSFAAHGYICNASMHDWSKFWHDQWWIIRY